MILIIDKRTGLVSGFSDGVPQVDERIFEIVDKPLSESEDTALRQNDMMILKGGKLEVTKRPKLVSKTDTLLDIKAIIQDPSKNQEAKNQAIVELINTLA